MTVAPLQNGKVLPSCYETYLCNMLLCKHSCHQLIWVGIYGYSCFYSPPDRLYSYGDPNVSCKEHHYTLFDTLSRYVNSATIIALPLHVI